jgi:hypothetical protein
MDAEKAASIMSRIEMTNWSSLEELATLQYELQYEYGLTAEEAQKMAETIGDANYAISSFALVVDDFGKMY